MGTLLGAALRSTTLRSRPSSVWRGVVGNPSSDMLLRPGWAAARTYSMDSGVAAQRLTNEYRLEQLGPDGLLTEGNSQCIETGEGTADHQRKGSIPATLRVYTKLCLGPTTSSEYVELSAFAKSEGAQRVRVNGRVRM